MKFSFRHLFFIFSMVVIVSCDSDDVSPSGDDQYFHITIGNQEPLEFHGSVLKLDDNIYQLSGNSEGEPQLTVTLHWEGVNPEGEFDWNIKEGQQSSLGNHGAHFEFNI